MDTENSRRSACDRCRGQKLRCVRPPRSAQSTDDQTLDPCVRCAKAGAECVSVLPTSRKVPRDGQFPSTVPSSKSGPDHNTLQPLLPKGVSYSPNPRTDPPSARAERTPTDSLLQKPSPEPNHQVRTEADDQYRSRPSKRRSVSNGHLAFGSSDFGSPSLRLGPSADMPFGTSKEPSFSQNGPFDMDIGSFSLSSASDPCEQVCGATPMMDLLLEAVPDEETSVSTFLLGPTWGDPVTPLDTKATDSREDDLHRLSELNSRIVRDFKGVNSIATADIISTLTRCELGSQACAVGPPVPKSPIGRVLESSQLFLELLQGLKPDQNQYAESECSYSEFQDESEFPHPRLTPGGQAFADMTTRDSATHRRDDVTAMLQSSNCLASVDMPMTLIILTCYTLLLQTYETIFSRIHESLFSRERLSRQLVPPVLPGLHIGGFYLNKHQDLQMDILISLSCRMLERIEEELGINVISESQDHTSDYMSKKRGLLEASYASAILEVMFKQKGLGHSQSYRGRRIAMVKETMENIRHMFKQRY